MNRIWAIHHEGNPLIIEKRKGYATPRPSKRLYHTERDAKIGLKSAMVPEDDRLEVVPYVPESELDRYRNAIREIAAANDTITDNDVFAGKVCEILDEYGLSEEAVTDPEATDE
jgi:hypothetical protein